MALKMDLRSSPNLAAPRLLADQMLARLARWLRLLGYDCALVEAGGPTGEALADFARREGRTLLTCGRDLAATYPERVVLIPHAPPVEQVRYAIERWPMNFAQTAFTRCSVCNVPIEPVAFEEVADQLPPKVRDRRPPLTRCPACGRLYWTGTHIEALRRVFQEELNLPGFP